MADPVNDEEPEPDFQIVGDLFGWPGFLKRENRRLLNQRIWALCFV